MDDKKARVERVYIFTGGNLNSVDLAEIIFNESDRLIGLDKGAEWLILNNKIPHYILGDFDSARDDFLIKAKAQFGDRLVIFPPEKDETDTELGLRYAISLEPQEIIIYGGTGTRLDHVLANIHLLLQAAEKNIRCSIVDQHNKIQLLLAKQKITIKKNKFDYVSLVPFSDKVTGINIDGFKYPIINGSMEKGVPYGISNELKDELGIISIETGILLIMESRD